MSIKVDKFQFRSTKWDFLSFKLSFKVAITSTNDEISVLKCRKFMIFVEKMQLMFLRTSKLDEILALKHRKLMIFHRKAKIFIKKMILKALLTSKHEYFHRK
jgi:hypothetical protein